MIDQASRAKENAIILECKKDGLQQRQSGDWSLRFTVAGVEIDHRLVRAPMGARYQCVLVEINDDETPVDHQAVDRDKWRDLGPAKQAGMRCKEPIFWAFLREGRHQFHKVHDEESAAATVRNYCGVSSRSELGKPAFHQSRILWHGLDNEYQGWKANEHA